MRFNYTGSDKGYVFLEGRDDKWQEDLMYGILWILMVGVARWGTGQMIGESGYEEILQGHAGGLDVTFGVIGAYVGSYLFLLRSSVA